TLHVATCAKTRDISLMITAEGRDPAYEWIAFDSLRKPGEKYSFFGHIIPPVNATELEHGTRGALFRLAQAETTITVLCQTRDGKNIVRTLQQDNKCVRETFSPFKGRVEKREDVACDNACPEEPKEG
ncbi:MAG: hypothetical protein K0U34_00115, partial [Alphaproteobacteria bacterium]|nr:hypothetical protein [Alphaproteobacteria bacterium]